MAVTVDSQMASSVAANVNFATSLTYSFTNTAGTYLVVGAECNAQSANPAATITGVTYAGATVTKYAATEASWDTGARSVGAFYTKQAPATGANNVVVSLSVSDNIISGAISVTGAAASAAEANGTANTSGSSTVSPTLTLTNVQASSLCLAWYGHGAAIQTALKPKVSCNRDMGPFGESVNEGVGLTTTVKISRATGGEVHIISGDALLVVGGVTTWKRNEQVRPLPGKWDGVAISATFICQKLPLIKIADLLPPAELAKLVKNPVVLRFDD